MRRRSYGPTFAGSRAGGETPGGLSEGIPTGLPVQALVGSPTAAAGIPGPDARALLSLMARVGFGPFPGSVETSRSRRGWASHFGTLPVLLAAAQPPLRRPFVKLEDCGAPVPEAQEGRGREAVPIAGKVEPWRGKNPRRVSAAAGSKPPGGVNGLLPGFEPLEPAGPALRRPTVTARGAGSVMSRPPRARGEDPEGENPMGVCGMK